jgi:hypothetical protein
MVFRERRPSQHRAAEGKSPDPVPDHELESFLTSISPGRRGDTEESASERTTRFGDAQVYQLRVPELRVEQLRALAQQYGMSPTALMLEWVLERLDQEDRLPVAPAPRRETDPVLPSAEPSPSPAEPREPATVQFRDIAGEESVAPLSPVEQLNPIGEFTPVGPAAPVTPLFRHLPGAHATAKDKKGKSEGPRHRAPEPVTSLHTRRRF